MGNFNSFETVARYYDEAYGSKPMLQDITMFKEFARKFGGPVLEIGCGTGRVLVPIAQMGIEIDGIDLSEPMLSVLRSKLKKEEIKSHVQHGDMRSFRLEKKYNLVTIPFRSMQHMISCADKLMALQTAKEHLLPDGRLIFDVAFPNYDALNSGFGQEYLDSEWKSDSENGRITRMFFRRDGYRKIDQVMLGTLLFRVYENEKVVKEEQQKLEMHFFSLPELEGYFKATGLAVENSYGSYSLQPIDENSSQMIFVLKIDR